MRFALGFVEYEYGEARVERGKGAPQSERQPTGSRKIGSSQALTPVMKGRLCHKLAEAAARTEVADFEIESETNSQ